MAKSNLPQHKAVNVKYTKPVNGRLEETKRTIIPTFVPPANIKAIDVTGLSVDEIAALEGRLAEYSAYYRAAASTIFSFDDWLEQSYQETGAKWRTFNQDNLVILAD